MKKSLFAAALLTLALSSCCMHPHRTPPGGPGGQGCDCRCRQQADCPQKPDCPQTPDCPQHRQPTTPAPAK